MKHFLSILMLVCILMTAITALSFSSYAQEAEPAAGGMQPDDGIIELEGAKGYNISANDYKTDWAQPVNSYLVSNTDGTLTRAECLHDFEKNTKRVIVETYSGDGKTLLNAENIPFELPKFGGFYAGIDSNYFVFGQDNPKESNSVEVLRIIKYSKSWERIGAVSLYGENTYAPLNAGSLRMTEYGGKLYVYTCHEMYQTNDGYNHQSNMIFVIDHSSMKVIDSFSDIMNIGYGYISHSLNQFIQTDGIDVYRVDHGDAYPRSICVTKASVSGKITNVSYADAVDLTRTGAKGQTWTGVGIGGFELAGSNCIIAGNVVNYQNYDTSPDDTRNIFLSVMKKDLSSNSVKMLTRYTADSGIAVLNPHLVKISDSKLLVLWEEKDDSAGVFHTRFASVDADGNLTSSVYSNDWFLSDCQPILCKDGYVRWYAGNGIYEKLYTLDPDNLSAAANDRAQPDGECVINKNLTMHVGERYHIDLVDVENAHKFTWRGRRPSVISIDSDYSIVAVGEGKSPLHLTETYGKRTIAVNYSIAVVPASTKSELDYMYYVEEGKATIVNYTGESADVVFPSTLGGYPTTGIGKEAFYGNMSLKSVTIPDSVTNIGMDAFFSCMSLSSVTIPDSVTNIGMDAFFSCMSLSSVMIPDSVTLIDRRAFGYASYDTENRQYTKVEGFTIIGNKNTEAESYARRNKIPFLMPEDLPTEQPTEKLTEKPDEPPTEAPPEIFPGDIDGDGVISVMDATRIQKFKAKLCNLDGSAFNGAELTDRDRMTADVDKDGAISVLDSARIQKYLARLCNLDGTVPYHE